MLYEHPAVAEGAVIGLPHPSLGEEVAAAVALKAAAVALKPPDTVTAGIQARLSALPQIGVTRS